MFDSSRQLMPMSEADSAEHLREKHLQMIMDAQQHGRKIPAVPVSMSVVGEEVARKSVEASDRTMHRASTRTFLMPALPWQKGE